LNRFDALPPLQFFLELDVLDLFRQRRLFGQVLSLNTEGSNHFDVELFTENDVVFEGGLDFEVIFVSFVEISKKEHAVRDFFLEKRDFFFD